MKLRLAASAALLVFSAPVLADTTINTVAPFSGNILDFGQPNTATYGQTFTVGADSVLNGFSMYLSDTPAAAISFRAYIYAWNGSNATGAALFTSGLQSFAGSPANAPQEFAFNTGATALTTGQQYVAFLSTAGLQIGGGSRLAKMPHSGTFGSNPYAGGNFVFDNNGDNFSQLTTSAWDCAASCNFGDVWFRASLSGAIPEPTTWALLILGFGAIGGAMRSTRRTGVAFA